MSKVDKQEFTLVGGPLDGRVLVIDANVQKFIVPSYEKEAVEHDKYSLPNFPAIDFTEWVYERQGNKLVLCEQRVEVRK